MENENIKKEEQNNKEYLSKDEFINIDDFAKIDLRLGKIKDAELVEGSEKLIKCQVDFGELGERTIVSGIAKYRKAEDLVGKSFLYIVNLKPRKIFGIESQGMLVALHNEQDDFAMLVPDIEIEPGTKAG